MSAYDPNFWSQRRRQDAWIAKNQGPIHLTDKPQSPRESWFWIATYIAIAVIGIAGMFCFGE